MMSFPRWFPRMVVAAFFSLLLMAGAPPPPSRKPVPLLEQIGIPDMDSTVPWPEESDGGSMSAMAYFGTYVIGAVPRCTQHFADLASGWAKAYALQESETKKSDASFTLRARAKRFRGEFVFRYEFSEKPPAAKASLVFQPDGNAPEIKPETIKLMQQTLGLSAFTEQVKGGLRCVASLDQPSSSPR